MARVQGVDVRVSLRGCAATKVGLVVVAVIGPAPVQAAGTFSMPFACEARQGRVVLTPAAETTYLITGPHEQQPVTACAANAPGLCRTWMAHKFDFDCGGARMAWLGVIGAVLLEKPWRGWIGDGRLHARMGSRWAQGSALDCASQSHAPGPASNGITEKRDGRQRPFAINCAPRATRLMRGVVIMPAGFAPVFGSGARFGTGAAHSASVKPASPSADGAAKAAGGLEPVAKSARTIEGSRTIPQTADKPPRPMARDGAGGAPSAAHPAYTVTPSAIRSTPVTPTWSDAAQFRFGLAGLIAAALALAGTTAAVIWRRRKSAPVALAFADREPPGFGSQTAPAIDAQAPDEPAATASATMLRSADALQAAVRAQVLRLTHPQRQADLLEDLALIEQRLMDRSLVAQFAARDWGPVQDALARIMTDLEQVQAALDDHSDHMQTREAWAMPNTRREAFESLGVNPDADVKIVKKIVDGLRQSWHPDQARDERDRLLREHKIKSINIAWDLIAKRRHQEAA
jgi:hypothetical protein